MWHKYFYALDCDTEPSLSRVRIPLPPQLSAASSRQPRSSSWFEFQVQVYTEYIEPIFKLQTSILQKRDKKSFEVKNMSVI